MRRLGSACHHRARQQDQARREFCRNHASRDVHAACQSATRRPCVANLDASLRRCGKNAATWGETAKAGVAMTAKRPHIVIVDDQPDVLGWLKEVLSRHYTVQGKTDPRIPPDTGP